MLKNLCKLWLISGLAIGAMMPLGLPGGAGLVSTAWADDHTDDDAGDDAGDDDDDDRVIRRARPRAAQAAPRRARTVALPFRAADEIIAPQLDDDDFEALTRQGFTLIEAWQRPDAGIARRLRIPPGATLAEARQIVRDLATGQGSDFNHFYRAEQDAAVIAAAAPVLPTCDGQHCADRRLIGWPADAARVRACTADVTIGVIDTGVNDDHQTFRNARLQVIRLTPDRLPPSEAVHGTAVTALLIGDPASRTPGLVPGARVVAVDAFHRAGGDERADTFTLIKALTELARRDVDIINLSLAGPANTALQQVITQLTGPENIIITAAVGNAGPKAYPRFPAGYGPVIAVTAVDGNAQVYRRAVSGPHVDLAAPGVNVWTAASISGGRPKTGTSFAAPFVTAALALMRGQNPDLTGAEAVAALARDARDLGAEGRDKVFGHGLISARNLCPG